MWSGPRNISTAMMRAWGSRTDCQVVDEPFYAYYLDRTGLAHPGRADVLASQPVDWRVVVAELTHGAVPDGAAVVYQKHMAHHLLPEVDRAALAGLRHAFLIRSPDEVVASYARVREEPTVADLGFAQQLELFDRFGGPVVDARDVLERPGPLLRALSAALAVPYDDAMLSWPAGPRPTDGMWGRHWYAGVWASTGFAPYRAVTAALPDRLTAVAEMCRPYYDALAPYRLSPDAPTTP